MDEYGYVPTVPTVLFACKGAEAAAALQRLMPTNVNCVYPGYPLFSTVYEIGVMSFEPISTADRDWYHRQFLTHLQKDHQGVVWTIR